ncbi:baseplate J/gp47 family protein [Aneurinibacillus terranovensis]|uniref:baseplate J/gp47 family protein n=1 Tax=Aneurinibacillus terranovensis TaxID=278991 RepID=UPI00040C6A75|nr:baseplate J/gp47 family protein [Aneurinibacillus terranovensis]
MTWPTKDDVIQVLVDNLVGPDKRIDDIANQYFTKFLIIGMAQAIMLLVGVLKLVYDNLTPATATDEDKLKEFGYTIGLPIKEATYSIHTVTLWKSSIVDVDTPVPDDFLVTTTPVNDDPPLQFTVIPGQNLKISAGSDNVTGVKVICTTPGVSGNVPPGSITLIAQAGFDYVTDSVCIEPAADEEDIETYRSRILERTQTPERGGTAPDYKIWAESVPGVASATVIPLARGNGTIDIIISAADGPAGPDLIASCQAFIDTKTPAEIMPGGVLVKGTTTHSIDVSIINCVWRSGYTLETGGPIVQSAIETFIRKQVNVDKKMLFYDLIAITKFAYDPADPNKNPLLVSFKIENPTDDITIDTSEMAVPGTISVS